MKKKGERRRFRHFRRADRDEISILLRKGYARADIARALGVHKSTISQEIARRSRRGGAYDPAGAERQAHLKRSLSKYQGMKVEEDAALRERIIRALQARRSPDEIAGRINRETGRTVLGKDAVYHWLYSPWGNKYAHLLCTRRRKRKKREGQPKREMIPGRIPLSMRPEEGVHGEGDLFVSPKRAQTPSSVAAVVEQESKYLWGAKMENRKPQTMARAMRVMTETVSLDDLTLDNGVENKNHLAFGIATFFCDPQSPWQKPLIEQTIGLIRRWFIPKGTDLRLVSEEELQGYIAVINGKYRKSLGYLSAYEAALERGILKTKTPPKGRVKGHHDRVAFEVRI